MAPITHSAPVRRLGAARAILSLPARPTHRRAAQLLRSDCRTGTDASWERAYTHLGTPTALNEAAWCRMLQTRLPHRVRARETHD